MIDLAFIQQCSPHVPPVTVNAIARTESSFNPWAIGVNSGNRLRSQPTSYRQAVQIANNLLANGVNFDLGLGQINSSNLRGLNLSVEQVLDPCTNLGAMQTIFIDCWERAKRIESNSQQAVKMAFSCYNTGNHRDGFRNGYVNKIVNSHAIISNALGNDPRLYATATSNSITGVKRQPPPQSQSLPQDKEGLADYVTQNTTNNTTNENIVASADDAIRLVNSIPDFDTNDTLVSKQNQSDDNSTTIDERPVRVHHSWDIFQDF